jgi:hypothetical protein
MKVRFAGKEVQLGFETECLGLCGARETLHVDTLKRVGRVYRQTFIDTYAKAGFAKLYDRKTPIMTADLRNGRVLPFHAENGAVPRRVLTDRGTEKRGTDDRHECERFLAVENIDSPYASHSTKLRLAEPWAGFARAKAGSPQITGIVERYRKTMLIGFHRIAVRKKIHATIGEQPKDLNVWTKGEQSRAEMPPVRDTEP